MPGTLSGARKRPASDVTGGVVTGGVVKRERADDGAPRAANTSDKWVRSPYLWTLHPKVVEKIAGRCAGVVSDEGSSVESTLSARRTLAEAEAYHERQGRLRTAAYLGLCSEAANSEGSIAWLAQGAGGSSAAAFATELLKMDDVGEVLDLETELIGDYWRIFPEYTAEKLFAEVGLDGDQDKRRAALESLAAQGLGEQEGPVRNFTLVCLCLTGPAAQRQRKVAGYIQFNVMDGLPPQRCADEDLGEEEEKEKSERGSGYILINHLKVARTDQQRGVATLLLAGVMRFAAANFLTPARRSKSEDKAGSFSCRIVYLSVSERNLAARCLYEKLGFRRSSRPVKYPGWVSMHRSLRDMSTSDLASCWLTMAWRPRRSASLSPLPPPLTPGLTAPPALATPAAPALAPESVAATPPILEPCEATDPPAPEDPEIVSSSEPLPQEIESSNE